MDLTISAASASMNLVRRASDLSFRLGSSRSSRSEYRKLREKCRSKVLHLRRISKEIQAQIELREENASILREIDERARRYLKQLEDTDELKEDPRIHTFRTSHRVKELKRILDWTSNYTDMLESVILLAQPSRRELTSEIKNNLGPKSVYLQAPEAPRTRRSAQSSISLYPSELISRVEMTFQRISKTCFCEDLPVNTLRHESYSKRRTDGTCDWLMQHSKWREWRSSARSNKVFWVMGKPGTGKSVLASHAIHHLEQQSIGTAYFYFGSGKVQSSNQVLLSLLQQLCLRAKFLPTVLEKYIPSTTDPEEFTNILKSATVEASKSADLRDATIVLDAWDQDNMDSLEDFDDLMKTVRATSWKLYVSSRMEDEKQPTGVSDIHCSLRDNRASIEDDLRRVAEAAIGRDRDAPAYGLLKEDEDLKRLVVDTLVSQSEDLYFWIKVQLALVVEQSSKAEIRNILSELPSNQTAIVRKALEIISQQAERPRALAQRSLLWLSDLKAPLTVPGLQDALAVSDRPLQPDSSGKFTVPTAEQRPTWHALTSCWKGLVEKDETTNTLVLAHNDVKQTIGNIWRDDDTISLGEVCLRYLLSDDLEVESGSPNPLHATLKRYPFLEYASRTWHLHTHTAESTGQRQLAERLFRDKEKLHTALIFGLWDHEKRACPYDWERRCEKARILPSLSVASRLGLEWAVKEELDSKNWHVDSVDAEGRSALHHAAMGGNTRIVNMLLVAGYSPTAPDTTAKPKSPLDYAMKNDAAAVFDILFTRTCELWLFKNEHGTLKFMSTRQDLLDYFDKRHPFSEDSTPADRLCKAVDNDDYPAVLSLICRGSDVNAISCGGRPILHHAVDNPTGSVKLVEKLLQLGANPSIRSTGTEKTTPLHLAASHNNTALVQSLLFYGADVNAIDNHGRNALSLALMSSSKHQDHPVAVAKLLLTNGIDVNHMTEKKPPVLHQAVRDGNEEFMNVLLQYKADVEILFEEQDALKVARQSRNFHLASGLEKATKAVTRLRGLRLVESKFLKPGPYAYSHATAVSQEA